jgi:hypothetical protein
MELYNYFFWFNAYDGIWYAIPRDETQTFFGVDVNKAKGVYKSKNINTLIKVVSNPEILEDEKPKKKKQ